MIRIRKQDGTTLDIPDGVFVEVCDLEGKIAQVSYMDEDGGMHVIKQTDPEARDYSRLFQGIEFVPIVPL